MISLVEIWITNLRNSSTSIVPLLLPQTREKMSKNEILKGM